MASLKASLPKRSFIDVLLGSTFDLRIPDPNPFLPLKGVSPVLSSVSRDISYPLP